MAAIEVPDWFRTVYLVGKDPSGDPVVVALDADGNIKAILYGMYDTTLKALKTDADGRLIAILTDPEDQWGTFKKMGFAGLARALSYTKRYDYRGDVVFATAFENGISGWFEDLSGDGAAKRHSARYALFGAYSLELVAGTDVDEYAEVYYTLATPIEQNMGVEFSFTLDPETSKVFMKLTYRDGADVWTWAVYYDLPNTTLSCGGSDGSHSNQNTSLNLRVADGCFHTIKLVADLTNKAFVRLLCDGLAYTPTAASVPSVTDTGAPRLDIVIRHTGVTSPALNPNIWIDNIVVTQNEEA